MFAKKGNSFSCLSVLRAFFSKWTILPTVCLKWSLMTSTKCFPKRTRLCSFFFPLSFYRPEIRHTSYIAALQSLTFVFKQFLGNCSVTLFSLFYVSQLLYVFYILFYTRNNWCPWRKVANNIYCNLNARIWR